MARLLLVEDNDDVANVVAREIRNSGHEVVRVATMAEARSLDRTIRFDAALIDAKLPDGEGQRLADWFYAQRGRGKHCRE